MSNIWGIPKLLEEEVKKRDKNCVHCGVKFKKSMVAPIIKKTLQVHLALRR